MLMNILPCVILDLLETNETVEIANMAKCSLSQHLDAIHKTEDYSALSSGDNMWWCGTVGGPGRRAAYHDRKRRMLEEDMMEENDPVPSNRKRRWKEASYDVEDEENEARSHPGAKKPRRYVIISESGNEHENIMMTRQRFLQHSGKEGKYELQLQSLQRREIHFQTSPKGVWWNIKERAPKEEV